MAIDFTAAQKLIAQAESVHDLNRINALVKAKWTQMQAKAANQFYTGERVTFFSPKRGNITGVVTKINVKTVKVRADGGVLWTVAPSLLKKEGV